MVTRGSSRPTFSLPFAFADTLWLVAAAGLLAIALVVYELQARSAVTMLLGTCGVILAVLVLVRPEIGLFAVLGSAIAVRVALGTGTGTPIVASLGSACVLLVGWIGHRVLHRQPILTLPKYVALPALTFGAWTLFTIVWGRLTLDARIFYPPSFLRVQLAAAALTIVSIGLLFVGADLLRDRRLRFAIMAAYVVTGFIALPFRAFPALDSIGASLAFINTHGLFGLWFVSICWANALINTRLPLVVRGVLAAGAVGWLMMAFFREGTWVSGWLPAAIAVPIVTLAVRPRLGIILAFCLAALIFWKLAVLEDVLITQQEHEGSVGGEFGRLQLWQRSLEILGGRAWIGTGPAGYALYYMTFVPDRAMSTHSNYVDTIAQTGVVGIASLLALLVGLGIMGRRARRRLIDVQDRAALGAVLGALPAIFVAMLFGDWLIPFVYNQTIAGFDHSVYSWLMLAMLCGLAASVRRDAAADG